MQEKRKKQKMIVVGFDGGPDPCEMQAIAGAAATALFGHARSMGALKGCGILEPPAEAMLAERKASTRIIEKFKEGAYRSDGEAMLAAAGLGAAAGGVWLSSPRKLADESWMEDADLDAASALLLLLFPPAGPGPLLSVFADSLNCGAKQDLGPEGYTESIAQLTIFACLRASFRLGFSLAAEAAGAGAGTDGSAVRIASKLLEAAVRDGWLKGASIDAELAANAPMASFAAAERALDRNPDGGEPAALEACFYAGIAARALPPRTWDGVILTRNMERMALRMTGMEDVLGRRTMQGRRLAAFVRREAGRAAAEAPSASMPDVRAAMFLCGTAAASALPAQSGKPARRAGIRRIPRRRTAAADRT